jgi:hypothetical protein
MLLAATSMAVHDLVVNPEKGIWIPSGNSGLYGSRGCAVSLRLKSEVPPVIFFCTLKSSISTRFYLLGNKSILTIAEGLA